MRVQVRFEGRVQGVGFRATAAECAHPLPLTGFVRNKPDGSVLLEAQGDEEEIDLFLLRISERMGCNITSADRTDLPERADEEQFTIRS